MERNIERHEQDLGIHFSLPTRENSPGYPRLEGKLRERPTHQFYDPEKMTLMVVSPDGGTSSVTVYHPWTQNNEFQVCAGQVVLEDRKGKKLIFYTFGGKLHIDAHADETTYRLESVAPILFLDAQDEWMEIPKLLADEAEILLAREAAERHPDQAAYNEWLANREPMGFYADCLMSLIDKYQNFEHKELLPIVRFFNFVEAEKQFLMKKNKWPEENLPPEKTR